MTHSNERCSAIFLHGLSLPISFLLATISTIYRLSLANDAVLVDVNTKDVFIKRFQNIDNDMVTNERVFLDNILRLRHVMQDWVYNEIPT